AVAAEAAQVAKALAAVRARLEWLPALGLGFASCAGVEPEALQRARRELTGLGGWLTAPGDWGPAPTSLVVHRSVKKQLDPEALVAPGRWVVGGRRRAR